MPYTRIFAAFMLATLISTLFALPAFAAAGDLAVSTTSVPLLGGANVTVGTPVVYTITVTNTDALNALGGLDHWLTMSVHGSTSRTTVAAHADSSLRRLRAQFQPSGRAVTWSVTVTVNAPLVAGPLTNVATIPADTDNLNNSSTNTTTTVATLADVTIAKSHTGAAHSRGRT